MVCNKDKFILNKNMSNEFLLTIKASLSTLPMLIDITDTFVPKLILLETGVIVNIPITVTVHDPLNGQIKLVFDQVTVDTLVSSKGKAVDKYYLKPTYKLLIDCSTVQNGKFVAKIPEVFVE
jgi:hypothetical protein